MLSLRGNADPTNQLAGWARAASQVELRHSAEPEHRSGRRGRERCRTRVQKKSRRVQRVDRDGVAEIARVTDASTFPGDGIVVVDRDVDRHRRLPRQDELRAEDEHIERPTLIER